MEQPQALFLDIDGTILRSDHSLSPRVTQAIMAIKEAGTLVCLATGRSWEALKKFYDSLELDGPTICCNGAFIVENSQGRRTFEINMDEEVARAAIHETRKRNMEMVAFRDSQLIYEKRGLFVEAYHQRTQLESTVVNFDDFHPLNFTKALIIAPHQSLVPLKEMLEDRFGPEALSATFSDPMFLELMGAGVTKARGLQEICRINNIDPKNTVAIGDGWNDIDLLQTAGDAWIMGGAPENLKALFPAHRIAPHADMDGAAVVIEAMMTGKTLVRSR